MKTNIDKCRPASTSLSNLRKFVGLIRKNCVGIFFKLSRPKPSYVDCDSGKKTATATVTITDTATPTGSHPEFVDTVRRSTMEHTHRGVSLLSGSFVGVCQGSKTTRKSIETETRRVAYRHKNALFSNGTPPVELLSAPDFLSLLSSVPAPAPILSGADANGKIHIAIIQALVSSLCRDSFGRRPRQVQKHHKGKALQRHHRLLHLNPAVNYWVTSRYTGPRSLQAVADAQELALLESPRSAVLFWIILLSAEDFCSCLLLQETGRTTSDEQFE